MAKKLSMNVARQQMDTFNLKNASREIQLVARAAGIKSGHFETRNQNYTVEELCNSGHGDTVVAVVSNNRKSIEITASDVQNAYLLDA